MADVRLRALEVLAAAAVLTGPALAHEDDPKARGVEPPIRAEAYRADQGGVAGGLFGSDGTTLMSWLPLAEFSQATSSGNDCWGYTSVSGREYAIIGLNNGTGFAEVTNPGNAQVVAFLTGPTSLWRDMKVFGEYAYVVSEGGGGIQIFDLSQIDSGVVTLAGQQTAGGTAASHNVAIDEVSGYLYRCGGGSNGLRIYDLNADPVNPPQVGSWSDRYVHDAQIVTFTEGPNAGRQIAFCFGGYNGGSTETGVDILDVTNKSAIVNVARLQYPQAAYCHQGWLSADGTTLFTLDEQDEINFGVSSRIHLVDVSDLANPVYLGPATNDNPATTHNAYVVGDRLFAANYRSGVRIYDVSVPSQPSEMAMFDTYPESDASGYNGCWSVFPYFPSGTVIASDMQRGLFVVKLEPQVATWSFPDGLPTMLDPAGESIEVEIVAGDGFEIDPSSARLILSRESGTSTSAMSEIAPGRFLASFPAMECAENVSYSFRVLATTGEISTSPAGSAVTALVAADSIADLDTLETETGWIAGVAGDTATSGVWERVIPVGTSAQPGADHTENGVFCFVTGQHQSGQGAGFNDVDGGVTTLISPILDAEGLFEPRVEYARWYSNNAGAGPNEDSMPIEISNDGGKSWVLLELVSENAGQWVEKSFRIADFLEPTGSMRLRFIARDLGAGSLVEAAIDDLAIVGLDCGEVSSCVGDINLDGEVNGADLGLVLIEWGQASDRSDLDGNGVVNGADLGLLLNGWGPCGG
ncbi:MAG: choice-of-anchor B family protein [Phycisphaerales bacterium]